jgi:hypothetical protein
MGIFGALESIGSKGLGAVTSFGQKALSSVNSIGSKATGLAHTILDNKLVAAGLASDPELDALVRGSLAGADSFLAGTKDAEKELAKFAPAPPKPSYNGLQKKPKPENTGVPPKPARPDWSFDQGFLNDGRRAPPKPTRPPHTFASDSTTPHHHHKKNHKGGIVGHKKHRFKKK